MSSLGALRGVMRIARSDAMLRIFCFPYAGGGASVFRPWADALPEGVELCAVQPPGRESRLREAPLARLGELVEAILEDTKPLRALPFCFLGHSVGALVAFETARALWARGEPLPLRLFVSGAGAPHLRDRESSTFDGTDEQLLAELRTFEGTPAAVLDDPEMMRLFLPILRADLRLREGYELGAGVPLPLPITAFGGRADPGVSPERLSAWGELSTAPFQVELFDGGHFFIKSSRDAFLSSLSEHLSAVVAELSLARTASRSTVFPRHVY